MIGASSHGLAVHMGRALGFFRLLKGTSDLTFSLKSACSFFFKFYRLEIVESLDVLGGTQEMRTWS